MILYIHGFRTTHQSYKAALLKNYFNDSMFISKHPHKPKKAIKYLENVIKDKKITGIIASSIGGFYATYLSNKYNIKTILINPSVQPYKTTKKYLGINTKDTGETFIWKDKYLNDLQNYRVKKIKDKNFSIYLQKGDAVLDYKIAKKYYKNAHKIIENDGSHKFNHFERHFENVSKFLKH